MRSLPSENIDPEQVLPNKDPFFKTHRIFNSLFKKNVALKEGKISQTNVHGFVEVNFNHVVTRKVVECNGSERVLSCGHSNFQRVGEQLDEMVCYRCGIALAYRSFEHEWSHIIFKSSPVLFDRFVTMYAAQFSVPVVDLLRLVVNAFDDIRVNSLWGLVYPGSASEIEQKWREKAELDTEVNTNFISWLFGVALQTENLDHRHGPFHDLIPIAEKAFGAVRGRGAHNMLLAVRWFMEQCIERLLKQEQEPEGKENKDESGEQDSDNQDGEQPPPESREEATERLQKQLKDLQRDQWHYVPTQHDKTNNPMCRLPPEDQAALSKMFNESVMDKQEVPTLSTREASLAIDGDMENTLKTLQGKEEDEESSSKSKFLLADAHSKVLLAEVHPEDILPASFITISADNEHNIDRMRAVFAKFIGKKTVKLIEDGDEIDVQALIQYRMDGLDERIFEDDGLTKGFYYLTLCDMSDSMSGAPFDAVCTAAEMLKKALDYPFVEPNLWGFRGAVGMGSQNYVTIPERIAALTKGGEIWLYKYDQECQGYISKGVEAQGYHDGTKDTIPVNCNGMTPTHTGLQVAAKYIASTAPAGMEKRLFLLTDGNPTQFKVDGKDISREALFRFVRKEVDLARSKGIKISTIIIGNEIKDEDADNLFGPRRFWRRTNPENIGQVLLETVIRDFVQFLRH